MTDGGAALRRTEVGVVTVADSFVPYGLLPTDVRAWLTVSPGRLAVLPADPAEVAP